jgi:beta-N-acetylhexosaminidase
MSSARDRWVDDLMGKMSLDQKIGQLLVFGFAGSVVTPDIVELVRKYHLGGLRITLMFRTMTLFNDVKPGTQPEEWTLRSLHLPEGFNRDYSVTRPAPACTPQEYAETLNRLRDIAMDKNVGVPLHFTFDQEGSASDDLLCGQRLFPHPMGLAASGDESLAYRVALGIGKQARALGANMVHSPVLDVNTNPKNPEIGTRAYSDNPEDVTRFALESLRGFQESGVIATGKHFPGRGESMADAHWGLPTVDLDLKTLEEVHVAPYRAMIRAGLPAIMMAHSLYPALGVTDEPSSCHRGLIQDYLRGTLGFKGVITTDNMMMGGLLQKYELREAVIRVLQAGCDLVLLRDESPIRIRIIEALREAVKSGRLAEAQIDEKVQRILRMRYQMGLHRNGGKVNADRAAKPIRDPFVVDTAREAAEKSVLLVRDRPRVLPLRPDQKILLVEQVFPTHLAANNMYIHPGLLWDEMCRLSDNVMSVEIPNVPTEADKDRVRRRLKENFDAIVTTNYYYHKVPGAINDLVREMLRLGKPVVAVTNTPYDFAAPGDLPTVLTVFNPGGREHLRAAAQVIFGKLVPTAEMPVTLPSS